MVLKPITIKDAVLTLSKVLLKSVDQNCCVYEYPSIYLKDIDGGIHEVTSFDLMRDKITCDDGYFDYFEYVAQSECYCDRLFMEV